MSGESANRGFSFIELAVALALAGLFLGTTLQTLRLYKETHAVLKTQAAGTPVRVALQKFFVMHGRYPCPADPSLSPSDPHAGLEYCTYNDLPSPPAPNPDTLPPNPNPLTTIDLTVGPSPHCIGGFCRALGARDTDGVNGTDGLDSVLIGSIPYMTINIPASETYDGWSKQLGYAVTARLALPPVTTPFPQDKGTVGLHNKDGLRVTHDPSKLDSFFDYHLLVWSYGSGQRGAYSPEGIKTFPCNPAYTLDSQNCANNGYFLYDLYPNTVAVKDRQSIRSTVPNPAYFYDSYILFYTITLGTDFWGYVPASTTTMQDTMQGSVGIGKYLPQHPLDVAGSIYTPALFAKKYCDETPGGNCFDPKIIGGSGISCNGYSMAGIQNGACKAASALEATWSNGTIYPGSAQGTCPSGQGATGIDGSGGLICAPLP